MRVLISCSIEGATYYLKHFAPTKDNYSLVWDTEIKLGYDFKTLTNPQFTALLEHFAVNHHEQNITYVVPKRKKP